MFLPADIINCVYVLGFPSINEQLALLILVSCYINCKASQAMSVHIFFHYVRSVVNNVWQIIFKTFLAVCIVLDFRVSLRCILTFGVICQFNK